jgi:hypothetical protein
MIVSIMQPYFFPYIGYFQLIAHSDTFVLFDDVQYIKRGWVNRNRILSYGKPAWMTLPVLYGPHYLPICARSYQLDAICVRRCIRQIEVAYQRAPHFDAVFPLVRELIQYPDHNVATFNVNLLRRLSEYLGIAPRFLLASELDKDQRLAGQELVVDICRRLGATHYVNPIGGTQLYQSSRFARDGIELGFLRSTAEAYPQFGYEPVNSLSIIDVLMFNSPDRIQELMHHYCIDKNPDAMPQITGQPGAA